MRRSFILGVIASTALCFGAGCSGKSGSIGAPPNSGQDGPQPPTGDPCAEATLSWTPPTQNTDGSELTDLAGFKIYVGFQSRVYSDVLEINDPTATRTVVEDLEFGREYFFAATALNARGIESDYSNEAIKLMNSCPTVIDLARPTAHH